MAWIRRVRTRSGSTAVQIIESFGGRRRILGHVGSARNEVELGLLMDGVQSPLDEAMRYQVPSMGMVPAPTRRAVSWRISWGRFVLFKLLKIR